MKKQRLTPEQLETKMIEVRNFIKEYMIMRENTREQPNEKELTFSHYY